MHGVIHKLHSVPKRGKEKAALFTADIAWSDGEVIEEVANKQLIFDDLADLLLQVQKETAVVGHQLVERLGALIAGLD